MTMLVFETAIGTCGVRWSDRGITEILMPGRRELAGAHDAPAAVPAAVASAVERIVALLDGESRDLRDVALDETGIDDFRRRVYGATRAVRPGETITYGEIARTIGEVGDARGVGAALGSNPFPIVVPCHRVLAATGALHGFSAPGGIATKRRMLEIERAPGFTQEALFG
jgi:methylated-DNA-[protein]-cysteine S-methyltransferase